MPDKMTWATVPLDMNDPLLDRASDRCFWLYCIPAVRCKTQELSPAQTNQKTVRECPAVQHTLNGYCLNYRSHGLKLDLRKMTGDPCRKIWQHKNTTPHLSELRRCGKCTVLLTSAHHYNLDVKQKPISPGIHLDLLLSTHTSGYPEKHQRLWTTVHGLITRCSPLMAVD